MAKRNNKMNKKVDKVNTNFKEETMSIIKVLVIVLVVFGLFYLLTLYITSKGDNTSYTKTVSEAEIQYSEILAGTSFSKDGEYIVVYYDKSDESINSTYTNLVSTYKDKEDRLNIYTVDMSSAFNKKFVSSDANTNPSSAEELKIAGPTLIRFKDGKVEEYIEEEVEITKYLI